MYDIKPIKVFGSIPEVFFDIFAYVFPGGYLLISVIYSIDTVEQFALSIIKAEVNWVTVLLLVTAFFGAANLVGQLLTTFSYFLLRYKPEFIIKRIKKSYKPHEDWYENYHIVKHRFPTLALLISKRYARWVSARSMSLACIVLIILNSVIFNKEILFLNIGLFLLFFIDSITRKEWLDESINILMGMDMSQENAD